MGRAARRGLVVTIAVLLVIPSMSVSPARAQLLSGLLGYCKTPGTQTSVFYGGPQGQMFHRWWNGNVASGPEPLGGVLNSAPAGAGCSGGRVDVVVRGTDNQVWHKWWDGRWNGWEPLPGKTTLSPPAAVWSDEGYEVYIRGADNQLWQKRWGWTTGWGEWTPKGGTLTSGPSATATHNYTNATINTVFVVARGTDGAVWRWEKWSNSWDSMGGQAVGEPTIVHSKFIAPETYYFDIFVRGTDNQLWNRYTTGGPWGPWYPRGGVLTAPPSASSLLNGTLDVWVRGNTNGLHRLRFDGSNFKPWEALGGTLTTGPGATTFKQ